QQALLRGWLSWVFTVYRIEADDLRIDWGALFPRTRASRAAPGGRRGAAPFIARLLGLAELLQVAGGGVGGGLAGLPAETDAQALRAEPLGPAVSGPDAGEAPEQPLVVVPMPVLIGSVLLSVGTWVFLLPSAVLVGMAVGTGNELLLLGFVPLLIAAWQFSVGRVLRYFTSCCPSR
ncbi:PH domain-containing protein, partial [Yinghuangia aomiensis]